MPNLVNDFEVRKETLRALGGNPDGLANIFEVDKEILKLISEGGSGIDWDTIKQKLAEDGVESIKFIMGNEQVILTASELKTLLNQTVLPDAPSDGKQYARQDGAWTVVESGGSVTPDGKYMTITVDYSVEGEAVIEPQIHGSITPPNLQYRINSNGDWNEYVFGQTGEIHLNACDWVQFKGNNPNGIENFNENSFNFYISGLCHLSGNVMSLIDGVGETLVIPNSICFNGLFENSHIKTVSKDFLPATSLKSMCYQSMFKGCKNLTQAPDLPATSVPGWGYNAMFAGCVSLEKSPELNATIIEQYCYDSMFFGCENLTQVQNILPAMELKYGCYESMFNGCKNLTQAPDLPATSLENNCYQSMFMNCINLAQAPELNANELSPYCYFDIFHGCSKLNYVKCSATNITADRALENWLSGVAPSGTFVKPYGVVYPTGSIPSGWTVKEIYEYTEAPVDGKQYARKDDAWVEVEPSKVKTTKDTTLQFWSGTQQEYDAIVTKDANTLYIIS